MAAMLREAELARLARAAERREGARADLAAHDAAAPDAAAASSTVHVSARHESWRAARRAGLNQILARETAAWFEARDRAARAFGRADVLNRLAEKRGAKR
jgi:hypothetical protein